jgi:hypothetical protein
MCDCEQAKASSSWIVKKARKQHWCCECPVPIAVGESYHIFSGVWDDFAASFKTCALCTKARPDYESTLDPYDCAPCLGSLWDDARNNDWLCRRGWIEEMVAG